MSDDFVFDPDFEMVVIGPTWAKDENGEFVRPEHSLGHECFRWTYKYLQHKGERWMFTPEQARFVLWFYALDDDGKFLFRDAVFQRPKGAGKEFLGAAIAAFEMLGPCRFSHWGEDGRAVGMRPFEPWVQVLGPAKDTTRSAMKIFPSMFTKLARDEFKINDGTELIKGDGGLSRIEALTSSEGAIEGTRPSFLLITESQHMNNANKGIEVVETARDNIGKVPNSRSLVITNAYQPALDSVARRDREAYEKVMAGTAEDTGFMYDSHEPPQDIPLTPETAPVLVRRTYGDATWAPFDDIVRKILDPRSSVARNRRMYLNQIVALDSMLIAPHEWNPCADPSLKLEKGDEIVMGLDAGKNDDSTALIGIRIKDRAIFVLGLWEKDPYDPDWSMNYRLLDAAVESSFLRYQVRAFFSDVHPIESYVTKWSDEHRDDLLIKASTISAVGYDMRGHHREIAQFNEALVGAVRDRTIKHTGDKRLAQHVFNTIANPTNWDTVSFTKDNRESNKKIDGYAATVLAYIALIKYLESGRRPKPAVDRRGWIR